MVEKLFSTFVLIGIVYRVKWWQMIYLRNNCCSLLLNFNNKYVSEPLSKLRDLGYINREIPFGESPKKSKKGLYHINDSLLRFHYQFIVPYRSILELGRIDVVMQVVRAQLPQFIGQCWELLCRQYVSGNIIDGVAYNVA